MATPAPALRPLSIGEILDAGIKVVLRNWKTLIGCTIALMAPLSLLYVVAIASIDPEQLELVPESTTEPGELPEASEFIGYGITFMISAIALFVCFGTCFKAVSDAWLGKKPTVGESLRYGLRRSPRIFVLWVILFLFSLVAWIPCFVPLIWLGVAWALAIPALLFEKVGPFKALGRSYGLTQNRWWATLGLLLVGVLLVSILGGIVQLALALIAQLFAPESVLANGLAQGVGLTIGNALTYPYLTAIQTILYFDQRVRKEGFDLQLMAESLGVEPDPSQAVAAPYVAPVLQYTPEQMAAAPYWPPPPGWQPPPPGWQPPPQGQPPPQQWSSPTGWTGPQAPPPSWKGPAQPPPRDERPAGESPWMTPAPGGAPPGRWAPPSVDAPPPSDEPPPTDEAPSPREDDEGDPPEWPPRDEQRGPGGL